MLCSLPNLSSRLGLWRAEYAVFAFPPTGRNTKKHKHILFVCFCRLPPRPRNSALPKRLDKLAVPAYFPMTASLVPSVTGMSRSAGSGGGDAAAPLLAEAEEDAAPLPAPAAVAASNMRFMLLLIEPAHDERLPIEPMCGAGLGGLSSSAEIPFRNARSTYQKHTFLQTNHGRCYGWGGRY